MRSKVLLLVAAMAFTFASNVADARPSNNDDAVSAKSNSLPRLSADGMQMLLKCDTERLTALVANGVKEQTPQTREMVNAVIKYNKALADNDDFVAAYWASIITSLLPGANPAEITGYMDKVLPLITYLMNNRVVPEMAKDLDKYTVDTVWRAPIDEMYYGLGDERNTYNPNGFSIEDILRHKVYGARPKHNQSYLWGMVTVGDKVYWCTNTNYLCVGGASSGLGSAVNPGEDLSAGYETKCWTCEFESGIYGKTVHAQIDPSYAEYSDTRIPRIYCYDTKTKVVEDITPSGGDYNYRLQDCQGLRSAGTHNGVVFFGGPSLYGSSAGTTVGASFFAYDADKQEFIGCSDMKNIEGMEGNQITDIRRWLSYRGVLYCGVRVTDSNGTDRGAILRWYGDKKNPWKFKIVGWTPNEAAELEVYNGRMYVGGWNTPALPVSVVVKGPVIPFNGLQPVNINDPEWQIVWSYSSYDKNYLTQNTTYTAGLKTWKGKLYWGMFAAAYTIPTLAAQMGYTDTSSPEALAFYLGNLRQTSFWRIDENDNIELLYGESQVPMWNKLTQFDQYGRPIGPDTWTFYNNPYTPKFGRAGYGELFTAYSWTMEEYHGDLYVGTMNMANLIGGVAGGDEGISSMARMLQLISGTTEDDYGFELLRWKDPEKAPEYITTNGFGNGTAYGIRNFTKAGGDLFVGSASPLNLELFGGCHLFKVNEKVDIATGINEATSSESSDILMKREAGQITFTTIAGDNLVSVKMYDASGVELKNVKANSHVAVVPTSDINADIIVVKIVSEKGEWTAKVRNIK